MAMKTVYKFGEDLQLFCVELPVVNEQRNSLPSQNRKRKVIRRYLCLSTKSKAFRKRELIGRLETIAEPIREQYEDEKKSIDAAVDLFSLSFFSKSLNPKLPVN